MFAMHSTNASNYPLRILAIETSGTVCSVALTCGERVVAEYTLDEAGVHDRMLALLSQRILEDTGNPWIDIVAVSSGPGSFTGMRIGFAFAKGLCFARNVPFLAVPTLEACAAAAVPIARLIHDCDIAALTPAHDELLFVQHFTAEGEPLTTINLSTAATIERSITPTSIVCGPGARSIASGMHIPGLERLAARFVGRRAFELSLAGIRSDPATATPLYVEQFTPRRRIPVA